MRLLLDTHVFLWAVSDHRKLKAAARDLLKQASEVHVSAVSLWEIAIKARIGRLEGDLETLAAAIETSGFIELPVTVRHAKGVATLPMHHADPFDRLLVAQALAEPLRLVTADRALLAYGPGVELIP